ncbi:MAG: 2-oxoglutarate and iron-dependent oxygenase domain-containing protein [Actinomycetota bacterium]
MTITIPVIDIADARRGAGREQAAAALDEAARGIGFFAVTGHGVDDDLLGSTFRASREFFARPHDEKMDVTTDESYRGYAAMSEMALAQTLGDASPPDLSESFNVGRYDEAIDVGGDPAAAAMCFPNLWPADPADLRTTFERYFAELDRVTAELLTLLALAVGQPDDAFVPRNEHANSTMMLVNYYPAVDTDPLPGQLRRGAHTDYGTITLLYAEEEPGLQIEVDGTWTDIPAVPGAFIVNIGDLLSAWVGGRWTSTLHRVVVPPGRAGQDRVSIPFFVHPDFHTPLPGSAVAPGGPSTAGEWIAWKSQAMMAD